MYSSEKMQWFAMRATYRRGMQIKGLLDQKGINSFIPMRYEIHLKNGHRRRELVPAKQKHRNSPSLHRTYDVFRKEDRML